jgi:hypothetical protein
MATVTHNKNATHRFRRAAAAFCKQLGGTALYLFDSTQFKTQNRVTLLLELP